MANAIQLSNRMVTYVDDVDYDRVRYLALFPKRDGHTWYVDAWLRTPENRHVLLHRLIMNEPDGAEIDHRDGNGLNNTRANLRIVTHTQNALNSKMRHNNTSGYRGVTWHKGDQRWRAQIRYAGGRFCQNLSYS